jgi:hypothetical protein
MEELLPAYGDRMMHLDEDKTQYMRKKMHG